VLIQRDDDAEETVRKRLAVYHQQTQPLVHFYKAASQPSNFNSIQGVGSVKAITQQILSRLEK
jgi:adenylate kinase